jgi:xanthine dehydrogenase large subunit
METQGAYAIPLENGNLKIYSSTQGPTAVQKIAAKVLDLPMNAIEVDVLRLGGGFGGKEDQATHWACLVALAAQFLKKPVKIAVSRHDDMRMTGKRHPYIANYKLGISKDMKIKFYEIEFIQDAGAAADLSPAITERTLFHATGSYYIPNAEITVYSCKTNTPPNTAFRGFGAPQAFFAIEAALDKAAGIMGVNKEELQYANLLEENDEFPYGQIAQNTEAKHSWDTLIQSYNILEQIDSIHQYNRENKHFKKRLFIYAY